MEQTPELRQSGIGGSDAAAVVGLSKYRTPLDVYREKIGEAEPFEQTDAMYFGTLLEDVIAGEYARRTEQQVRRVNKTFRHKDLPYMMAHVDRMIVGKKKGLECKTAGKWFKREDWGDEGSDLVPPDYLLQCQHYMEVIDLHEMDLAALLAGNDWRIYTLKRDAEIGAMLRDVYKQFWKLVQDRTPPEPKTIGDLAWLYPKDNGQSVITTDAVALAVTELGEVNEKAAALKKRQDELKLAINHHMKDATLLIGQDGRELATLKAQSTSRIDEKRLKAEKPEVAEAYTAVSEYRVLRLRKGKSD